MMQEVSAVSVFLGVTRTIGAATSLAVSATNASTETSNADFWNVEGGYSNGDG